MITVPALPPGSAITVRSEPHCLTLSWEGRRGTFRRVLALPGRTEKLLLYRDRLVYTEWPHPRWGADFVLIGPSRAVPPVVPDTSSRSTAIPRDALHDVQLERTEGTVRLMVRYGLVSRVEIGATLGEDDKAWLTDVLRRWIAG